jgi:protein gp37
LSPRDIYTGMIKVDKKHETAGCSIRKAGCTLYSDCCYAFAVLGVLETLHHIKYANENHIKLSKLNKTYTTIWLAIRKKIINVVLIKHWIALEIMVVLERNTSLRRNM